MKDYLVALVMVGSLTGSPGSFGKELYVESFHGPVTANEIVSFRNYIAELQPASDNIGNQWAQHASGEAVKAMQLVYEMSGDQAILDRMIQFCDAVLSERNDVAPAPIGQYRIWTGRIDPVWPNQVSTQPIQTGGEQGDLVGHLANCGRLILKTPLIWKKVVAGGDRYHFGATYFDRAKRYIKEADVSVDRHLFASLLDLSDSNRMYFKAASPYKGGQAVPWNQQMMFNYAFQNLAEAHALLKDDATHVARYDAIVQASLDWFFTRGIRTYMDKRGNIAYDWGYAMPNMTGEDNSHGALDVAGLYRAFISGRYNVTAEKLKPIANTVLDVMRINSDYYAGRLNGTDGSGNSAPTDYLRSGYLLLAEFRPNDYMSMMAVDLKEGSTTGKIDRFSRFLWVKNRLYR